MQSIIIKDKKGRLLLQAKGDRCVIARHPDMDNKSKLEIAELYAAITNKNVKDVMKFLNFESDIQEFCS